VKRGNDQHIIYTGSEGDKNAKSWKVKVELNDLATQCSHDHVYFTIRQADQIQSFILPQKHGDTDMKTMRRGTHICPFAAGVNSTLSIALSTDCQQDVQVEINVGLKGWQENLKNGSSFYENAVTQMTLEMGIPVVKYIATDPRTKSTPGSRFYKVDLKASPQSDCICSIVSIQNATCPYSDVLETSMRYGIWQTMLNKSTLVVDAKNYPNGYLIVVIASPSDKLCQIKKKENKCQSINRGKDHNQLSKEITITVKSNSSDLDYMLGILSVSSFYIVLLVVTLTISLIRFRYDIRSFGDIKENSHMKILWKDILNSEVEQHEIEKIVEVVEKEITEEIGNLSILELLNETNKIKDRSSRQKNDLKVSEMSQKLNNPSKKKSIYKKSSLYVRNLLLISIFYCLPILQMVTEANSKIDESGNQDLCYFNHLCQKPLGTLHDFNHVFSNLGYIFLGFFFISIVYYKESKFLQLPEKQQQSFGIPQQFSLFYAMGLALVMEGILSASYHVCPGLISFQFDTTYMYLIAILMQMKLYQSRHADICCSANLAFLSLGGALILEKISMFYHGIEFWTVFCIIYCIYIIFSVTHNYHMGVIHQDKWYLVNVTKLILSEFKKHYQTISCIGGKGSKTTNIRPRSIYLVLTTLFNLGLCLYFAINEGYEASTLKENASSLCILYVFIGNMLAYVVYYVTMKFANGESLSCESWFFIICSHLVALPALYFFNQKENSSTLSPAESRALNRDCIFLNFYDGHDVWHFLSGGGIFFFFMFLLTIDENLKYTRRDLIQVF